MDDKKIFLEKHCRIVKWTPTDYQISLIFSDFSKRIDKGETLSISDCQGIILKYCPDSQFMFFDSVDNSDLNTLIILAMKKNN
jgi:hypothetical protein